MIVQARAQVFMGFFSPAAISFLTFFRTFGSTNGPFLVDRLIYSLSYPCCAERRRSETIIQPQAFFLLRVLKPFDSWFHGERGWLLPFDLPRPPPSGWSVAFMAP